MLGLVYLAWLYLRKVRLAWRQGEHNPRPHDRISMSVNSANTRRWQRYQIDLPVRVIFHSRMLNLDVPGRGTELSQGGMSLYAGLPLQPGDPVEVQFQTPSNLRVAGIIRNRTGYWFGLEFLALLAT
jgi:PilZ domain